MSTMLRLSAEQLKAHMDRLAKLPTRKVKLLDAQAPVVGGKAAVREIAKPKRRSAGEEALELALKAENIAGWVPEYRFDPERRWRADFAFPEHRLLVEVEGGVWLAGGGRHTRGQGFLDDCAKYNAMTIQGWRLLRFATSHVNGGYAVETIKKALENTPAPDCHGLGLSLHQEGLGQGAAGVPT